MLKLEPCPFCGHKNVRVAKHGTDERPLYWVHCRECGASGPDNPDRTVAITRWNAPTVVAGLQGACQATCRAIEFRGKHAMASFDELAEDESNWQDGVEPYLLDVYNQNLAALGEREGTE